MTFKSAKVGDVNREREKSPGTLRDKVDADITAI